MEAAAASASQVQVQQLTAEVQQLKAYYDNLHHQLQQAQQLKSAAESQIEAWRAQHAQQAPRVAELLSERQAWIEELQRERAAASAAAAAAEASDFPQSLCSVCHCNDLLACIISMVGCATQ
jgi:predicted  nucleic acid-binding Zn-ribbon protein